MKYETKHLRNDDPAIFVLPNSVQIGTCIPENYSPDKLAPEKRTGEIVQSSLSQPRIAGFC